MCALMRAQIFDHTYQYVNHAHLSCIIAAVRMSLLSWLATAKQPPTGGEEEMSPLNSWHALHFETPPSSYMAVRVGQSVMYNGLARLNTDVRRIDGTIC